MAFDSLPNFRLKFEPTTIDHLGLRLYSTMPPVISELVSNAWDAEAPRVEVKLPLGKITPASEVIIRDFGHGMSPEELVREYLPIGRPRRGLNDQKVMSKNGLRRVTGRKGLGKLSAFGIATEVEIRSIQNGTAVCLLLNYDSIKQWMQEHPGEDYAPEVVAERTGPTKDKNGLCVTLRQLHRKSAIIESELRRGLARRLTMIGKGFDVVINDKSIGPGDRVSRDQCLNWWNVEDFPHGAALADGNTVSGWIGFLETSSQANRGVDIYATGKAVELNSYFNYASTQAQFARAYLVGELHADFLDAESDLISTARNSVVWEHDAAIVLQTWGHETLKWVLDQWIELRRNAKEEVVIKVAGFDKWLQSRPASEQRVAQRMVKMIAADANIDPLSARPLLEIIKSSVEAVAFRELVEAIESDNLTTGTLLNLFNEWRIIEAREHLKLADGRVAAIEQLEYYMQHGALEVQQLQALFDKHPWLIDPAWREADRQATYTKLLREHCKDPKQLDEANRRLDIFGMRASRGMTVVELKQPRKVLSREDLEQIERYVDWANEHIVGGTGPDAPKYVNGLLLVGSLGKGHREKIKRLAGSDIRVETFDDLVQRAKEYYGDVEERLATIAPEYSRSRRKQKKSD